MMPTRAAVGPDISMIIDDHEPGKIISPGIHVLRLGVSAGDRDRDEGYLEVSLRILHHGIVANLTWPVNPVKAGESFEIEIPLNLTMSGLHTLQSSYASGGVVTVVEMDLEISHVLDRWQEWREPMEISNRIHPLLAFYYPWYGTPEGVLGTWVHWNPVRGYDSTHAPLIGFYDSLSEEVIDYHVRIAQSAGLSGFISSWWGPGNYIDEGFERLLDVAGNRSFEATIYLENVRDLQDLQDQLSYVLTRYADHPAFLRYAGRPVIFIYGRVMGMFDIDEFESVFTELRAGGLDAFYLADRLDVKYLTVFDGLHTYSPLSSLDRYPELSETAGDLGRVFAATIAPGYDDTIIRKPGLVVDRANGTYYRDSWEIVMLSKPQWVLLTSWNEWHEGSEIEPSLEFGDLYLNLTSYYYSLFESGRLTPRWEDRIIEIEELLVSAAGLIEEAERKGIDTRILARDLNIAQSVWGSYDYGTAKMYLQRILGRADEISEKPVISAGLIAVFSLLRLLERKIQNPIR